MIGLDAKIPRPFGTQRKSHAMQDKTAASKERISSLITTQNNNHRSINRQQQETGNGTASNDNLKPL